MIKYDHFKTNVSTLGIKAILISGLIIFNACNVFGGVLGDYAITKSSAAVKTQVINRQLPEGYKYYYTGREGLPYAVIGIDPQYKLESKFWTEITGQEQVITKIKHLMRINRAPRITYGKILDKKANQIGVWFSEYHSTIIRLEENNRLTVFSPYSIYGDD